MVYKHFRTIVVFRVLILGAFIFLFLFLIFNTSYYAATLIVGFLIIYQIYTLIQYVEKTNRDLTRFLEAIKHSDFSQTFITTGLGSSFNDLKAAFNEVIVKFQEARAEKEEHYRYLQTVVQHVGIGLIAFDSQGNVNLINKAARRLFRVPYLRNIKALKSWNEEFVNKLFELKSGQRELMRVDESTEEMQLMIYATEFKMQQQHYTLVSIQNIGSELEEKEMEAWQKLIRVLTHEIMNSITPISSLANTANEILDDSVSDSQDDANTVGDVRNALQAIQSRSKGLMTFVDAYRNLTRIPKPNFQIFPIADLFDQIKMLMRKQVEEKGIKFEAGVKPSRLELTADPELLEQILINLLQNAVQAVEGQAEPCVNLLARMDERGKVVIQVSDNGPGMNREVQEKIFIPFYTTKKGGSGIGLSLSKQIMRLHRGTISVHSQPNVKTVFTLRF